MAAALWTMAIRHTVASVYASMANFAASDSDTCIMLT
jgi:hypothetical protein